MNALMITFFGSEPFRVCVCVWLKRMQTRWKEKSIGHKVEWFSVSDYLALHSQNAQNNGQLISIETIYKWDRFSVNTPAIFARFIVFENGIVIQMDKNSHSHATQPFKAYSIAISSIFFFLLIICHVNEISFALFHL